MLSKKKIRRSDSYDYEGKIMGADTPFAITEAFKMLRTNMLYLAKGEKCPTFGVTSAYAHAGKSVIIANVAVSFVQLGKKVLLIDADMRCPVQHKIFGIKKQPGLAELLAGVGSESYEDYVIRSEDTGVDVIISGRIPPNPSELLSSARMRSMLGAMKEKYDYVFFDMPPICEVTDAGAVSDCITGYLLTVRAGQTDRRDVDAAVEILERMNADIAGIVLNDVNVKGGGYGKKKYGKYSKYGYYRSNYESRAAGIRSDMEDQ